MLVIERCRYFSVFPGRQSWYVSDYITVHHLVWLWWAFSYSKFSLTRYVNHYCELQSTLGGRNLESEGWAELTRR